MEQKKREDFRAFLDSVLADLPGDQEVHAIVDNYSTHKMKRRLAGESPVSFHSDVGQLVKPGGNPVFAADAQCAARSRLQEQRRTARGHCGFCAKAGVIPEGYRGRFGWHNLRHSLATYFAAKGVNLPVIQSILRHAKLSTTAKYTHRVNSVQLAAQAKFLEEIKVSSALV